MQKDHTFVPSVTTVDKSNIIVNTDRNQLTWQPGDTTFVVTNPALHAAAAAVPTGKFGFTTIGWPTHFAPSAIDKSLEAVKTEHDKAIATITADRDKYKKLYEEVRDKLAKIRIHSEHTGD